MPVPQLMQYLSGLAIKLVPETIQTCPSGPRTLQFEKITDDTDLERAYRLTVSVACNRVNATDRISFAKRAHAEEIQRSGGSTPIDPGGSQSF